MKTHVNKKLKGSRNNQQRLHGLHAVVDEVEPDIAGDQKLDGAQPKGTPEHGATKAAAHHHCRVSGGAEGTEN